MNLFHSSSQSSLFSSLCDAVHLFVLSDAFPPISHFLCCFLPVTSFLMEPFLQWGFGVFRVVESGFVFDPAEVLWILLT